jgi:hypothetical protein
MPNYRRSGDFRLQILLISCRARFNDCALSDAPSDLLFIFKFADEGSNVRENLHSELITCLKCYLRLLAESYSGRCSSNNNGTSWKFR